MNRKLRAMASIEQKLKHVGQPIGIVEYPLEPGEPERSIERFKKENPDYDGGFVCLPEKDRYEEDDVLGG